ncbi:MAG TPA: dephospho-CoA kinase [Rhodocyclaceae bacterium]|nr:dephospho-CoA kinase [Rhodocyclaceae bacterium]
MSAYVVGVSGGIGSGKSTVAERFARLGAGVVDTDHVAHALTASQGAAIAAIRRSFGDDVIGADGALDRVAMRRRVFADPAERQRLEAILHPLIRDESQRQCVAAASAYVLLLIPLLAETRKASAYAFLDRILIVDCDEATQRARVMARNGLGEAEVRAIMATQASRASRLALADDVVLNDGPPEALDPQVAALDLLYQNLAAAKVKAFC